jgi:prepilin-type processing-associated H-X9-DG protein
MIVPIMGIRAVKASSKNVCSIPPLGATDPNAFTTLDLAVTMAVLTVLLCLHLSSMANSSNTTRHAQCANNLRLLTSGWDQHAADNQDQLIGAAPWTFQNRPIEDWTGSHWLTLNNPRDANNWDTATIRKSPLFAYVGNSDAWVCPSDPSSAQLPSGVNVRSYALNGWVGGPAWLASGASWPGGSGYNIGWRVYRSKSDFITPGPANTFVFIDERPDSLNDGYFAVDMKGFPDEPGFWTMVDFPGHFHLNGANFSFADGHVDLVRWIDPRSVPRYRGTDITLNVASPNNPDVFRIQQMSTRYYKLDGTLRDP